MGLFATKNIRCGDVIGKYYGEILDTKSALRYLRLQILHSNEASESDIVHKGGATRRI